MQQGQTSTVEEGGEANNSGCNRDRAAARQGRKRDVGGDLLSTQFPYISNQAPEIFSLPLNREESREELVSRVPKHFDSLYSPLDVQE